MTEGVSLLLSLTLSYVLEMGIIRKHYRIPIPCATFIFLITVRIPSHAYVMIICKQSCLEPGLASPDNPDI